MSEIVEELKRPVLTFPKAEAQAVTQAFAAAGCILEYGSGGSTLLAAGMPGKRVFTVESDANWLAGLRRWFAVNPPRAKLVLHHADIGPTKAWGYPVDEKQFRKWPGYPNSVWERPDFQHPDMVLIDGRFRLACLLTTMLRIKQPTVVLVDDYIDRGEYHEAELLQKPMAMIGRMARFELTPQPFPQDWMGWVAGSYLRLL